MIATLTSKGQITIPLLLRKRLNLKAGDRLEFDEAAPVLTARRVVDRTDWAATVAAWQDSAATVLSGHPWADQSAAAIVDDLRGGPAETLLSQPCVQRPEFLPEQVRGLIPGRD